MATHGLPAWPHLNDATDNLPEPERLLLDAARVWAAPGPAGPMGTAALILAAQGAEGAVLLLDPLLRALPGLRPACLLCPRVSPGEAWFLLALAAAQHRERGLALSLLHRLAPPLGAYRGMPMLIGLAQFIRSAGMNFRPLGK